jgi:predicted metal-dependent hydrolase
MRFFTRRKRSKRLLTERTISLNGEVIPYALLVTAATKYLKLQVTHNATLQVTAPKFLTLQEIEIYILKKQSWIVTTLARMKSLPPQPLKEDTIAEYKKLKDQALHFVQDRIKELNIEFAFTYNEIHIKNHKTLWGSCSRKGNLNFNYKIVLLTTPLADYIIVHELCHLQEFNHSQRFWDLVAKKIPNHKELRKELKLTGMKS